MSSLWFAHGPAVDEVYATRDFQVLGPAFLPDRRCAPTGELALARGHVVPGALFRAAGKVAVGRLSAGAAGAVVTLTADGFAHRARRWFPGRGGASPRSARVDDLVPKGVFVYGTLRAGEERHAIMQRAGFRRVVEAAVRGRLVDLGEYPGLLESTTDAHVVAGELYEYEDPRPLLRELDEVEDFFGYDSDASLYRRSLVDVPTCEGPTLAWVYMYVGDVSRARFLRDGDWKRRA